MSPKMLSSRTGIHMSQLSDFERGIQPISLRRAFQIANVLGVPFDDVLTEILQERLDDTGFTNLRVHVSVVTDAPEEK